MSDAFFGKFSSCSVYVDIVTSNSGECHYLFAVVIVVGMRANYYACICTIILVLV